MFPDMHAHRMDEDTLDNMIRQMMEQTEGQASFGWQGGEPTLMGLDFFKKTVEFQERYHRGQIIGNGLQTNGLLIDGEWASFLSRYKFLVGLSLDGPEHIHDRYRIMKNGGGSWAEVLDRAKLLLDNDVAVNALCVVNDYSANFPEEIYEFHKELGLRHMQFIPCVEQHNDDPLKVAPFSARPAELGDFLCKLFDLWIDDFVDGVPTTFIRFFDSVFYRYVDLDPPECTLLKECGIYVVVEHNGDVYSCDFFVEPEWRLGNISEDSIIDMLNSPRQNAFGKLKTKVPPECKKCRWFDYCRGGCIKDKLRDPEGRMLDYFCEAYKMFFEHAHPTFLSMAKKWKAEHETPVGKSVQSQTRKPRRNDPCPCGSGLKYKKCCGK